MKRFPSAWLIAGTVLGSIAPSFAEGVTQDAPLPAYRVGAYASSGELWWAGERAYAAQINIKPRTPETN